MTMQPSDVESKPVKRTLVRLSQEQLEDFVRRWQRDGSVITIARAFGISPASAGKKASDLRKHGVPLKVRPGGPFGVTTNYAQLAAIAKERP